LSPLETGRCTAVLFDLDGTLVDTAPDMVAVLQELQRAHGIAPVDYALGRAYVSNGALGLLGLGFPEVEHAVGSDLHTAYLERYALRVCEASTLFPGLAELLEALDAAGLPWGVVTNKPAHLTAPLLDRLALATRSACTVSGAGHPGRPECRHGDGRGGLRLRHAGRRPAELGCRPRRAGHRRIDANPAESG
jgi:phosphoglycolate phosphatase-like HAD superfamily hydrolase